MAARRRLFATAAAVWLLTCWLRANPTGELSHHYTDHLRHMGESVALVARGFAVYREPYEKATAGLKLPCSLHVGLWGWAFLAGALAFRHSLTPFWQWIDFALHGVR